MDQQPTWGFIGASTIAKSWVIPAVKTCGGFAKAVYSSNSERGQHYAKENDIEYASQTLEDLLSDSSIDAVYISTTNELHKEQCLTAAAAGKHVLCEKPLALSLEDALEMQKACQAAGVVMATNHHLRNAVTHQTMRELVKSGELGDILSVRVFHAVYLPENLQGWRINSPKAGGGVILDITVHDADTLRFILDDEVEEVTAMSTSQGMAQAGLADSVMGVMRFKSGVLAQFHDSFTTAHAHTGLEIHGSEASLFAKDVMTQEAIGTILLKRGEEEGFIELPNAHNLYEHAIQHFHTAMAGQGEPFVTAEDGIKSLAIALAVQESCELGKTVKVKPI